MILGYLRSSSYNEFDFCEQKYFINYVLGYPSLGNKKSEKGNCTHKSLELVALSNLAKKEGKKKFEEAETGKTYNVDDFHVYVREGYELYKNKSEFEWTDEDFEDCNEWFWTVMNGPYNPAELDLVAPEQKFDFEVDKRWAKFEYEGKNSRLALKGTMDLVFKQDGILHVLDYKTGQRKNWNTGKQKDYDYLQTDPQLLMYYYAACQLFGRQPMIVVIYFIRDGGPFELAFGDAEYEEAEKILSKRMNEILDCELPDRIRGDFKCRWCPYSSQKTVWNPKTKEWDEIQWPVCDFINFQMTRKRQSTEQIRELYGIEGAFSKYGDGGGRSQENEK